MKQVHVSHPSSPLLPIITAGVEMFYSVKSTAKKNNLRCSPVLFSLLQTWGNLLNRRSLSFLQLTLKSTSCHRWLYSSSRSMSIYWNLVFMYFLSKREQPSHENTTPWIDVTKQEDGCAAIKQLLQTPATIMWRAGLHGRCGGMWIRFCVASVLESDPQLSSWNCVYWDDPFGW